jgi:hypothetical protein
MHDPDAPPSTILHQADNGIAYWRTLTLRTAYCQVSTVTSKLTRDLPNFPPPMPRGTPPFPLTGSPEPEERHRIKDELMNDAVNAELFSPHGSSRADPMA